MLRSFLHLATPALVRRDSLSLAELVLDCHRLSLSKHLLPLETLVAFQLPQVLGGSHALSVVMMPVENYGTQLVLQFDNLLIDFISFSLSHSALFTPIILLFFTIMVLILKHLYLILQSVIFTTELLH